MAVTSASAAQAADSSNSGPGTAQASSGLGDCPDDVQILVSWQSVFSARKQAACKVCLVVATELRRRPSTKVKVFWLTSL